MSSRAGICAAALMLACLVASPSCSTDDSEAPASSGSSATAGGGGGGGGAGGGVLELCEGTCAAEPAAGWNGPVALYVGPDPAPPCPAELIELFNGHGGTLAFDPAVCACTCSGLVTCSSDVPVVSLFEDGACTPGCVDTPVLVPDKCVTPDPSNPCMVLASASAVGGPMPLVDACGPSQTVTKPEPQWTDVARACKVPPNTGGGCAPGEICVPAEGPGMEWCIGVIGEAPACPPGPYSERVVLYGSVEDTRSCGDCTCDPQCPYQIDVFDTTDCSNASSAAITPMTCVPIAGPKSLEYTAARGECVATAGVPMGTVTRSSPVTFCCEAAR